MIKEGLWIASINLALLTAGILPEAAQATAPSDCSDVTIDNATSDWEDISALTTDGQDIVGTTYYSDGTTWSTTQTEGSLYSTNIDQMSDLETVKVCNSATQLQLYIDAFHPLLTLYDLNEATYYEFGDSDTPSGEIGLPADLDLWLVYKMQEQNSSSIYYYAIYLYADAGSLGLENGPSVQAIYQESSDADFSDASFNPNEDTLLVEVADDSDTSKNETKASGVQGGKNIDASGGFETDVSLLNADGTGLFSLTDIAYGDTLNLAVETYSGADFQTVSTRQLAASNDSTDAAKYKVKRAGVTGVTIADRTSTGVTVSWDEIAEADNYQIQLRTAHGKVLKKYTSEKLSLALEDLTKNHRYGVRVRALVGDTYTAYSHVVMFRTKKE